MTTELVTKNNVEGDWEVLTYPDPRLREKSKPIVEITEDIYNRGLALMDLMHEVQGIGISAPQVGWPVRLLAINLTGQRRDGLIFLNPTIESKSKATFAAQEACLSIPNISGKVVRPREVVVKAMNLSGEVNQFELDGLLARCFLHEFDHLTGVLFIDRLGPAQKLSIKSKLKKLRGKNK
jgi:peptide deformylase